MPFCLPLGATFGDDGSILSIYGFSSFANNTASSGGERESNNVTIGALGII